MIFTLIWPRPIIGKWINGIIFCLLLKSSIESMRVKGELIVVDSIADENAFNNMNAKQTIDPQISVFCFSFNRLEYSVKIIFIL